MEWSADLDECVHKIRCVCRQPGAPLTEIIMFFLFISSTGKPNEKPNHSALVTMATS